MARAYLQKLVWPDLEDRLDAVARAAAAQDDTVRLQAERIATLERRLAAQEEELSRLQSRLLAPRPTDPALTQEVARLSGVVPLSWVRSSKRVPFANFGDALSALVVHAISGLPVTHRAFNSAARRLVAVGTIGQGQSGGAVHFWGTGVDANRRGFGPPGAPFAAAPGVDYTIHAVRGPYSRRALLSAGIPAPAIYGDPGWFLPRILRPQVEKKHELGVVLHISEQTGPELVPTPREGLARYLGGEAEGVRLISTYHDPSWAGFVAKLEEILSCSRIVSTSFHGLLIAETYGIPCLYFAPGGDGLMSASIEGGFDRPVDHRFADFFRGAGRGRITAYGQVPDQATAWDKVIEAVGKGWEPMHFTGEALFDAFPLPPVVAFSDERWPVRDTDAAALPW